MRQDDEELRIDLLTLDRVMVLEVVGEVDLLYARELKAAIMRAVDLAEQLVVVDLCACTFMDSSGLNALITGRRRARLKGTEVVLACTPSGVPEAVLRLSGLDGVLAVHPDRASALRSVLG